MQRIWVGVLADRSRVNWRGALVYELYTGKKCTMWESAPVHTRGANFFNGLLDLTDQK